jgi:AraC family transcriptional regulator
MAIQDELLSGISLELLKEASNQSLFGKIYVETLSQLMIIRLLNRHIRIHAGVKTGNSGLPRHLQNRIQDYINENLAGDISINVLATLSGLSSYHFIRMFNRSFGVPPHQYVLNRRIEKAKQLLTHSAISMTQVALEVGYQSHSHFSNAFRKLIGCTPSQYRKGHR